MTINYITYSEKRIKATELKSLYDDVGWWPERQIKDIEEMLNQDISVGVWNDKVLIGFARAITDGRFRAYIEDVVIHKDFQQSGIGEKLITRLLKELTHIDVISLFCDEDLISFYEKNHFKQSKSQFVMHMRKS